MARALVSLFAVFAGVALAACVPPGGRCPCFVCDQAVSLTVVDTDGLPVNTFVVEAIVNGASIGEPSGCGVDERNGNSCSFGAEIGTYHLIVSAPGYETRESMVRVAEVGGGDLCCRACLRGRELTLELTPLEE